MTFNEKKFNRAKFIPRTSEVPVPGLAEFFDGEFTEDTPPVWIVRNLSGDELAQTNEAAEKVSNMTRVIEAMAKGEQAEAIKEILGLGDDVKPDLAKRITALMLGSVAPKLDQQMAVKLFAHRPVQAFELTNAVFALTGLGSAPGK